MSTLSTRAIRGPCRHQFKVASTSACRPSKTASTVPSRLFLTHPETPNPSAARWVSTRKNTPCTRPDMTAWALTCFSMFTSQIFGWKAMMLEGWKADTLSPNLPSSFLASRLYSLLVCSNSFLKASSSIMVTPSSVAFLSFEPGDSPTTT